MSATLQATDLAAAHGDRVLFDQLNLVVAPGDVIGLVGANGAGKSTLLRLLAGLETPESGSVSLAPAHATVGLLPQEPERRPGETVAGYLARRTGVAAAQEAMDAAATALGEGVEGADEQYATALERWLALGGADLEDRVPALLAEVGLGADPDALMTSLSGGQAARAGLAALLASRYDVLLLDEPTNDLDLDGLARLEAFVTGLRAPAEKQTERASTEPPRGRSGTRSNSTVGMVIVSHDREFLARTVNRVVELDLAQRQVGVYQGGYQAYLAEREIARQHAREAYEQYAGTVDDLKSTARTQRAWMAKGVRNARRTATSGSERDKHIRHHRGETSEKQAAKARQTERRIERLDVVEEPRKEWQLRMSIASAPRAGAVVATLRDAVVRRGSFQLGPVSAQVDWGDRIAITGANGSGKSTLLGALLGRLPLDSGSASLGSGVRIGEVDQARGLFLGAEPLVDAFGKQLPDWPDAEVRTLLAKFGLTSDHVGRPAESLSAGERTRAALALLQAREVNLLVLDEPTNHLDLPAIEQLEQALDSFGGTVLLVTHDRRMLETVRVNRRWNLDGGRLSES
ncbi:MAG TPA: ABC-F family ATP-binding cassette domain-containing protein [Pseudonocardia sp.]|nr:ABC-F family ATP-binding cassette domain-containing protein [Pseudonocardia sp.]